MTEKSQGERLAVLSEALDNMVDTIMVHLKAQEDRIIARLDATLTRIEALEKSHNSFRDSFADENGPVSGKAVMNRIAAAEKAIIGWNRIATMGRGAFLLAGFVLLMAAKTMTEALEWVWSMMRQ